MHWAPVYEVVFGWFLRRTHGAVLRIGVIKDGLQDIADGSVAAVS